MDDIIFIDSESVSVHGLIDKFGPSLFRSWVDNRQVDKVTEGIKEDVVKEDAIYNRLVNTCLVGLQRDLDETQTPDGLIT